MVQVDIGIFAHNEAAGISEMLEDFARQDLLADSSLRILILANGCTDDTAARAREIIATLPFSERFEVYDLPEGGKSRTWNLFVHELSGKECEQLVFCDADIRLPDPNTLQRLIVFLRSNPQLWAVPSRAVKDIVYEPLAHDLGPLDKLIAAAGGGGIGSWRHSICGQLYGMRSEKARRFHLPIGLPVEDGFVRAMITTDVLTAPPQLGRIDGDVNIYHVYESERSIKALIRHQTRLVIGSAINAQLFETLGRSEYGAALELQKASKDPDWLPEVIKANLPNRRFGWIPWSILTKRLRSGRTREGLKGHAITLVGFCFDAVVYVIAQVRMARGTGAGYW